MNDALKNVLQYLLHHHVIGGKHIPERFIIKIKTIPLNKFQRREFFRDYKSLINQEVIFRQKKRTGKGYEEHISINPSYVEDIESWIGVNCEVNDGEDGSFL